MLTMFRKARGGGRNHILLLLFSQTPNHCTELLLTRSSNNSNTAQVNQSLYQNHLLHPILHRVLGLRLLQTIHATQTIQHLLLDHPRCLSLHQASLLSPVLSFICMVYLMDCIMVEMCLSSHLKTSLLVPDSRTLG